MALLTCCKHSSALFVIREQLHREHSDGIFISSYLKTVIVRFACSLMITVPIVFSRKFVASYQFMRIIKDGEGNEFAYRIDWRDMVFLLENPVVKSLKIL